MRSLKEGKWHIPDHSESGRGRIGIKIWLFLSFLLFCPWQDSSDSRMTKYFSSPKKGGSWSMGLPVLAQESSGQTQASWSLYLWECLVSTAKLCYSFWRSLFLLPYLPWQGHCSTWWGVTQRGPSQNSWRAELTSYWFR
jgi:hypothetical protein